MVGHEQRAVEEGYTMASMAFKKTNFPESSEVGGVSPKQRENLGECVEIE